MTECPKLRLSREKKIKEWVILAFRKPILFFVLKFEFRQCKFIYSEKATKFCEISTLLLPYVVPVKSKVEILKNFVAFSECMNFK